MLTIGLALAPTARASETQVIVDFQDDGIIQGHYSIGDLRNAPLLMRAINPAQVGPLLVLVNEKISHDFIGIQTPVEPIGTNATPPVADLPAWFVATVIGAALLAAAGIGSAIYRRTRRNEIP